MKVLLSGLILSTMIMLTGCDLLDLFSGDIDANVPVSIDEFRVTVSDYTPNDNLHSVVENNFGSDYRLADWNDVLRFKDVIVEWISALNLREGERYYVSLNNELVIKGFPAAQYYFTRGLDPSTPDQEKLDSIQGQFLILYASAHREAKVLAVKR